MQALIKDTSLLTQPMVLGNSALLARHSYGKRSTSDVSRVNATNTQKDDTTQVSELLRDCLIQNGRISFEALSKVN